MFASPEKVEEKLHDAAFSTHFPPLCQKVCVRAAGQNASWPQDERRACVFAPGITTFDTIHHFSWRIPAGYGIVFAHMPTAAFPTAFLYEYR
jgi:hypothetical protein